MSFLIALMMMQAAPAADISWADPAKVQVAEAAMERWYGCLRVNAGTFAKKRSSTADELATAVMFECRQSELAYMESTVAVLASSSSIDDGKARQMVADMKRGFADDARHYVISEIVKARP